MKVNEKEKFLKCVCEREKEMKGPAYIFSEKQRFAYVKKLEPNCLFRRKK